MKRKTITAALLASCALAGSAQAETLSQFFAKSQIDGQIRSYYFSRLYGTPNTVNAYAYSLAGRINVLTAPFLSGFRVGVSFYTAWVRNSLPSCAVRKGRRCSAKTATARPRVSL